MLKSQRFDLVLLDINLPDGNGYEIAKTIREKYSDTIVTFLTANDRESDEIRGYEVGVVDYITKPFSIHSLQRKVENVLRIMKHHATMQEVFDDGKLFLNFGISDVESKCERGKKMCVRGGYTMPSDRTTETCEVCSPERLLRGSFRYYRTDKKWF